MARPRSEPDLVTIFYGGNGVPRTVSEVYASLTSRHGNASAGIASTNALLAPTAPAEPTTPTAVAAAASQGVPQTAIPDVAASGAAAFGPPTPHFRSLFQTEGRGAVSPVVSQLWGPGSPVSSNPASVDPAGSASSAAVDAGTRVNIVAEDVPDGISAEDHAAGLASSLAKLAAYLEQ